MRTAILGLIAAAALAIWVAVPARAQGDAQLPTAAPAWSSHITLFDGDLTTMAIQHNLSGGPAVITAGTGDASFHQLTRYRIMPDSYFSSRAPDAWTIEGLDASGTWDVLHTVDDDPGVWTAAGQAREFALAEPTAKSYYRFRMTVTSTKSGPGTWLQFAELQYYGVRDAAISFPLVSMAGASYTCNRGHGGSLATIFDNDISTGPGWIASGYPGELVFTVTLPASYALKAIAWGYSSAQSQQPAVFRVRGSTDGVNWTTIADASSLSAAPSVASGRLWTMPFFANSTRYARYEIAVTSWVNTAVNTDCRDIRLYGSPPDPPTVATPASANPGTVTGTTAALGVLGSSSWAAESALTYTWSCASAPAGAAAPTFSPNGTNAAKHTTVTFGAAGGGSYTLRATISDGISTVTSDVAVQVTWSLPAFGLVSVSADSATALLSASIVDGGAPTGTVTASGFVYGTSANPTLATGTVVACDPAVVGGPYSVAATGLAADTTYYYRAYATNLQGTGYSEDQTFTTRSLTVTAVAINATGVWDSPAGGVWIPPAKAPLGKGVRVRAYGSGFSDGGSAAITLTKAGHSDIVLTDLTCSADGRVITSGLTPNVWTILAPLGDTAALGLWSVTVTNSVGDSAMLPDAVEITDASLTRASLTANLPWPQVPGTTIRLTASSAPATAPGVTYRFDVRTSYSGANSPLGGFGGPTCDWTPAIAQPYWLTVVATNGLWSVRSADLYFLVAPAELPKPVLTVTDNGDGTYALAASPATAGGTDIQYRFVANVPIAGTVPTQYTAVTMWSYAATATRTWQPSDGVRGKTLKLVAYARLQGSAAGLQKTSNLVSVAVPNPVLSTVAEQPLTAGSATLFRTQNAGQDVSGTVQWEWRMTTPTVSIWTVVNANGAATQNVTLAGLFGQAATYQVRATWRRMYAVTSVQVAARPYVDVTLDFTGATATGGGSSDLLVNPNNPNWSATLTVSQSYSKSYATTGGNANSSCISSWAAGVNGSAGTTTIITFSKPTYLKSLWAKSSTTRTWTFVRTFADNSTASVTPSFTANVGQTVDFSADWMTQKVTKVTILRPLPVDNPTIYLDDFVVQSQ